MTEQQIHSHAKGNLPLIELKGVTKSFKGFQAIKPPGIDLKIMPQEVLVIIGSSGSGKSTLLRCMNRLIEPTTGQVFFEGVEITPPNTDDLTREEIKEKKQKETMSSSQLLIHFHIGILEILRQLENIQQLCQ